jgi:hypothetical protein
VRFGRGARRGGSAAGRIQACGRRPPPPMAQVAQRAPQRSPTLGHLRHAESLALADSTTRQAPEPAEHTPTRS